MQKQRCSETPTLLRTLGTVLRAAPRHRCSRTIPLMRTPRTLLRAPPTLERCRSLTAPVRRRVPQVLRVPPTHLRRHNHTGLLKRSQSTSNAWPHTRRGAHNGGHWDQIGVAANVAWHSLPQVMAWTGTTSRSCTRRASVRDTGGVASHAHRSAPSLTVRQVRLQHPANVFDAHSKGTRCISRMAPTCATPACCMRPTSTALARSVPSRTLSPICGRTDVEPNNLCAPGVPQKNGRMSARRATNGSPLQSSGHRDMSWSGSPIVVAKLARPANVVKIISRISVPLLWTRNSA